MQKKIIALLLILVFVASGISGCSKKKSEKSTGPSTGGNTGESTGGENKQKSGEKSNTAKASMGRYMEKKVQLPETGENESVTKILQNPKKQIEVFTCKQGKSYEYFRYQWKEDKTWEKSKPEWLNGKEFTNKSYGLSDLCIGGDGNYYACFQCYEGSEYKCQIIKSSDDGKTAQLMKIPYLDKPVQKIKGTAYYPSIKKMAVLQNGDLVLNDTWNMNSLLVLSSKGEELDNISVNDKENDGQYVSFIDNGNKIISMSDGSNVFYYNSENKNTENTVDFKPGKGSITYAVKDDGTLFIGDSNGIHRLVKGGTLWETVVDGALNSMNMPSAYFDALFITGGEQEEYYAAYTDGENGYQLMQYVFDKNVSSVPSKEITVYSIRENKTIRQAISVFQSQNSDIKVNYVVAMGEEDQNVADFIRALNTELLSGNGADVLVLDGLPVASYIEKGVLKDISDVINPLKASGDLLSNIADGFVTDGKIYRMPTRFAVPVIVGSDAARSAAGSLKNIADYINQSNKLPYAGKTIYRYLLSDYLALYSDEIFENGELNEEKLADFLKNTKTAADNMKATEVIEERGNRYNGTGFYGSDMLFRQDDISLGRKSESAIVQINDVVDTMIPLTVMKNMKYSYNTINQMYLPKGEVGLNSTSKDMDTAKKFISFLFTKDVQKTNLYDGLPVNPASLTDWFTKENDGMCLGTSDQEGNEIEAYWPSKDERDAFLKVIQQVKKPIELNYTLNNMIIEEAVSFLNGEADLNQVTAQLKAKVNTYLSE